MAVSKHRAAFLEVTNQTCHIVMLTLLNCIHFLWSTMASENIILCMAFCVIGDNFYCKCILAHNSYLYRFIWKNYNICNNNPMNCLHFTINRLGLHLQIFVCICVRVCIFTYMHCWYAHWIVHIVWLHVTNVTIIYTSVCPYAYAYL